MRLPLNLAEDVARRVTAGRSCGECTACCVLPRVPARPDALPHLPDGKEAYTPCPHLGCRGCGVYETRPEICRAYECLWRSGHLDGDERRRPDNLGLMFGLDKVGGRVGVEAWELWEGAASSYPGRGVLDALKEKVVLVAVRYYGVPCSLVYKRPEDLLRGQTLSRLAAEDPPALARWLEEVMARKRLEIPDETAYADLGRLRAGELVKPHLHPKEVNRGELA